MQTRRQHVRHSRGFTLLELMIVIGVIALLAGISYTVIGGALDSAKRAATLTTITKIDRVFHQQLGGFYRYLDTDKRRTEQLAGKYLSGTYQLTSNKDAALAMARKGRVKHYFPQRAVEVYGPDTLPGRAGHDDDGNGTTDDRTETGWPGTDDAPLVANGKWQDRGASEADSAELLYLIVTDSTIPGAAAVDRTDFLASELGDTDGDGYTEFLDAWGQPLRFYRWPTRLVNPWGYRAGRLAATGDMLPGTLTIQLASSTQANLFNQVLTDLTTEDPSATIFVAIGDEIIEVNSVAGDTLNVAQRGAKSTDPAAHSAPALVKLAPFTQAASLLLGSVNSSLMSQDHDDLFGVLADPANVTSTGAFETEFHTFSSYAPPLIMSIGPDGINGLEEPYTGTGRLAQVPTAAAPAAAVLNAGSGPLADNLTNHMEGLGN